MADSNTVCMSAVLEQVFWQVCLHMVHLSKLCNLNQFALWGRVCIVRFPNPLYEVTFKSVGEFEVEKNTSHEKECILDTV